jgi:RHS repeat-associated protein
MLVKLTKKQAAKESSMPGLIPPLKKFSPLLAIVAVMVFSITVSGQDGQYDRGTPPQHAAGVSPLGSYTSADLGAINLSNGGLNFKLPLATIGGRGFSIPLSLNYSSKVWSASRDSSFADESGNHPVAYAVYADIENLMDAYSRVAPGWTIGAAPTIIARGSGIGNNASSCSGDFQHALTKLTIILPDKGEIQLRDDLSDGAPLAAQAVTIPGCFFDDGYRGRRWHATDGSGIVFISDNDNGVARGDVAGVLITADGTRYRFVNVSSGYGGSVGEIKSLGRGSSITDRSGNMITITYPTSNEVRYTDQLGRITKIQKNVADPNNPSVTLALLVTIPGYQGQNRYFKIKTAVMNSRYRSGISPTLPVINGDYDPLGWGLSWGTATRLFSLSHGLQAQRIDVNMVLSEFILPDGRALQFFYNQFGEVAEVQMPTGGKVQYDYQYEDALPAGKSLPGEVMTSIFHSDVSAIERAVVARRTYSNGVAKDADWSYSYTGSTAQVIATSTAGAVLLNQKHYFQPSGRNLYPGPGTGPVPDRGVDGSGYNLWSTGIESRAETLNAAGSAVIAASEQDWTQRVAVNWSGLTTYAQYQPEKDNRVNEERKILDDLKTARVTYLYDLVNNPTQTSEYDFDNTLKRRTVTSYSSTGLINGVNYADDSIRLLRLPIQQSIYDGASVEQARTIYEYDIYTGDGNHNYLLSYASITGHDTANYGLTKTARGNATRVGNWIKTSNTYIYTYPRYDIAGNVVSAKDGRGNVTTISFTDDFGNGVNPGGGLPGTHGATYALPTLITSPPPVAGAPVHTARSQYDFSTGLLTGFEDRNGTISQILYSDPFNRPTQVKSALGISGLEAHARMYYAPATAYGITLAKNDVMTVKDQTSLGDAVLRSWTHTDGFGRATESWNRDPQGDVKSTTIYDGLGRAKQASNPFRPSLGETAVYTTNAYDLAGRVTTVTTPDSAVVTTSYSSNTVTVTDQAGKKRKSVTDALGRLTQVYEDPTALNYSTTYAYDVLDNLTTVTQGVQPPRTFTYDSLKRLKTAANPESGTTTYSYDNNGNLLTKLDARSITTTYAYDALNRNTTVNYSNTTINPDLTRTYDGATNGIGRLWASYAGGTETLGTTVEHLKIQSYDALGRPLDQRQRFKTTSVWSAEYRTQRTYKVGGSVANQIYPSNRTVTYAYDSAGRTSSFTGNLGDGVNRNYATAITYSPFGGMTKEQFGTATLLYNKLQYNVRGQLWDIRVGTDVNDTWNRGALQLFYDQTYSFGGSGIDNNGNVLATKTYRPLDDQSSTWSISTDYYTYDALNRLKSLTENHLTDSTPEAQVLAQFYIYDRYGNRTIDAAQSSGGVNEQQFTVNAANNRLGVPSGQTGTMTYDAAGNLTTDTYSGSGVTRAYDAENRMTSETQAGGLVAGTYTYNADGQRVRRKVNGVETWQIYGMEGELLAEYAVSGAVTSPQKEYGYRNGQLLVTAEPAAEIKWLVSDHLGTPRIIIDKMGSLANVKRHDYLPFGEELLSGTGGRTLAQGYSGDNIRQKFTQYEQDNETGLDYAQARYYARIPGRFTSPDPLLTSGVAINPKTWNRYSYALNNPLRFTDPTGLLAKCADATCNGWEDEEEPGISQSEFAHQERLQDARVNADASRTNGNPEDICTDYDLTQLFTDGMGIVRGVGSYRNEPGIDAHYMLADGAVHSFHIYGNESATTRTGIYIPASFYQIELVGKSTVVATNPKTKETINVYHVLVASRKELKQNIKETNVAGSKYIGQIGGPGGNGKNDVHAHVTLFRNRRSRDYVHGWIHKPVSSGGFTRQIDSSVGKHTRDIRTLVQRR